MTEEGRPILIFRVADQQFGLEVNEVEAVVPMVMITPLPRGPHTVSGVIDVGGEVVPVFSIRRRFGLPERENEISDFLVLAKSRGRKVAVAAEEIVDVDDAGDQWVGTDEIEAPAEAIGGAVKTEDGLVMIQDLNTFLSLEEHRSLATAIEENET